MGLSRNSQCQSFTKQDRKWDEKYCTLDVKFLAKYFIDIIPEENMGAKHELKKK